MTKNDEAYTAFDLFSARVIRREAEKDTGKEYQIITVSDTMYRIAHTE
jgi:hypothetical protein